MLLGSKSLNIVYYVIIDSYITSNMSILQAVPFYLPFILKEKVSSHLKNGSENDGLRIAQHYWAN